jgi:hypothetical protein
MGVGSSTRRTGVVVGDVVLFVDEVAVVLGGIFELQPANTVAAPPNAIIARNLRLDMPLPSAIRHRDSVTRSSISNLLRPKNVLLRISISA